MKTIKIIFVLVIWAIYIYLYNILVLPSNMSFGSSFLGNFNFQGMLMNVNNWLLGAISSFSVLAIICGGAGYIFYSYSNNKEKEQMFKKIFKYGSIILFFTALTYSLTTPVIVYPIF